MMTRHDKMVLDKILFTNPCPHVHRYTLGQLQMSETVYVICKQHADGGLLHAPVPVARTTPQARATTT